MKNRAMMIGYAALALAAAFLVVALLLPVDDPAAGKAEGLIADELPDAAAEVLQDAEQESVGEDAADLQPDDAEDAEEADSDDTPATPEEKALVDWERVFDSVVKAQDKDGYKPSSAVVAKFKEMFDRLTEGQKLEEIHHAQNLLTDAAVDCLTAVLMDPKEPNDVLESVYGDMLNRPDEIKYPILRKVYKVSGHPLRSEIKALNDTLSVL